MDDTVESLKRAAAPLLAYGYGIIAERPAMITVARNDVRIELTRERWEWFVNIGSVAAPTESFDSHLVLSASGTAPKRQPRNEATLRSYCEMLVSRASQWEPLFERDRYPSTRKHLRECEREHARRVFGVDVDQRKPPA